MILKVFVKTTLTKQKHGYQFEGKESDFAVYILFWTHLINEDISALWEQSSKVAMWRGELAVKSGRTQARVCVSRPTFPGENLCVGL